MKVQLIVQNEGPMKGKIVPIAVREFTIGRDPACQLKPGSEAVAAKHCMIRVALPNITVEDLGSTTGTLVNGAKITGKTVLKGGEKLSVGPLHFLVVVEKPAPIRKPAEASDDDAAAMLMDGDEPMTPATRTEAAAASAAQEEKEKPKPAASPGGHGAAPAGATAPEEKKSSADAARSLLDKFKKR